MYWAVARYKKLYLLVSPLFVPQFTPEKKKKKTRAGDDDDATTVSKKSKRNEEEGNSKAEETEDEEVEVLREKIRQLEDEKDILQRQVNGERRNSDKLFADNDKLKAANQELTAANEKLMTKKQALKDKVIHLLLGYDGWVDDSADDKGMESEFVAIKTTLNGYDTDSLIDVDETVPPPKPAALQPEPMQAD